jgi:mRNA-degrading endonuclease YafQ of YafQ-DinJ toxin-antitoxin module
LAKIEKISQTPIFKKAVKKLKKNQKNDLDDAVKFLVSDPDAGIQKNGDLAYLRVYKFKMVKQEMLLGYSYEDGSIVLELLNLGTHENFYRDMK